MILKKKPKVQLHQLIKDFKSNYKRILSYNLKCTKKTTKKTKQQQQQQQKHIVKTRILRRKMQKSSWFYQNV